MKYIKTKVLTALILVGLMTISTVKYYTLPVFADGVTAHITVVGSNRTIYFGDVTTSGCSVTDIKGIAHTYTTPVAICVLDAASHTGNFPYTVSDFGGTLGLLINSIAEDKGASDGSTYWLYDVNGQPAQVGVSNLVVKNSDKLLFHFFNPNADVNQRAINDGISYIRSQQGQDGSIQGFTGVTPWSIMAFASAGIDSNTVKNNGKSVLDYLAANPPASDAAPTEWEKDVLAITAAGKNPYNFGGVNYEAKVESFASNGQIGNATLINDDVFGLLSLISSGPNASSAIKQNSLNFILAHQLSDGGFTYATTSTTSDVDDTAAALQALLAVQKSGVTATGLTDAIGKAKTYLVSAQKSDGGFPYSITDTASNTSSTAWVTMALSAGGGNSDVIGKAKTFILENQEENGSFHWQSSQAGETFTTSYVIPALENKSWPIGIFSGTTVTPSVSPIPTETPTVTPTISLSPTPTPSTGSGSSTTPTVTPVPTVGNKPGDNKKEVTTLVRTVRKEIQKDLQQLDKNNRTISIQIQTLLKELTKKIHLLFGVK